MLKKLVVIMKYIEIISTIVSISLLFMSFITNQLMYMLFFYLFAGLLVFLLMFSSVLKKGIKSKEYIPVLLYLFSFLLILGLLIYTNN